MTGVRPDVIGPDAESVSIVPQLLQRNHMAVVAEADYPTLKPGETWTAKGTFGFPGDRQQWVCRLNKPGEYRLALVHAALPAEYYKNAYPFILGAWQGTVASNELAFKVEADKALTRALARARAAAQQSLDESAGKGAIALGSVSKAIENTDAWRFTWQGDGYVVTVRVTRDGEVSVMQSKTGEGRD